MFYRIEEYGTITPFFIFRFSAFTFSSSLQRPCSAICSATSLRSHSCEMEMLLLPATAAIPVSTVHSSNLGCGWYNKIKWWG